MLSLFLAGLLQDSVAELVRDLGVDALETREEATRKLMEIGKSAVPELKKAVESGDLEVQTRARRILKMIDAREKIPPGIRERWPEGVTLLADAGWTEFLRCFDANLAQAVKRGDLSALLSTVAEDPITKADKMRLLEIAQSRGSRAMGRPLLALLNDEDPEVRANTIRVFLTINARDTWKEVLRKLEDGEGRVRAAAATTLSQFGVEEAIEALLKHVEDPHSGVRSACIDALKDFEHALAVPAMIARLKDDEFFVRSSAAHALGKLKAREATAALKTLLDDPHNLARAAAVRALGWIGEADAADDVARMLSDKAPDVRVAAAHALAELGAKSHAGAVAELAEDESPEVRREAAEALCELQPEEGARALVKLLEDRSLRSWHHNVVDRLIQMRATWIWRELLDLAQDENCRHNAKRVLDGVRPREAAPELMKLLRSEDPEVCRFAMYQLFNLGVPEAEPEIARCLESGDPFIRYGAVECLWLLNAKSQAPGIIQRLRDEDEGVRAIAAQALGSLESKEAAAALRELLQDSEVSVRNAAALAVGKLGVEEAAPEILKLLKDDSEAHGQMIGALVLLGATEARNEALSLLGHPSPRVRALAARALLPLKAYEEWPRLVQVLADEKETDEVVDAVKRALVGWGAREAAPELRKLLKHPQRIVRLRALDVLVGLADKDSTADIIAQLGESDLVLRTVACSALERLGAREAVPKLLNMMTDDSRWIRTAAASALAKLDAGGVAVPSLIKLLDDEYDAVRGHAIRTLGLLGAKEAAPHILPLLRDRRLCDTAALVLGEFGSPDAVPHLIRLAGAPYRHDGAWALLALNSYRCPELLERLKAATLSEPKAPTMASWLRQLSESLGIEAKLDERCGRDLAERMVWARPEAGPHPAGKVMRKIMSQLDLGCVMEPGRITFMPREDALKVWRTWALEFRK